MPGGDTGDLRNYILRDVCADHRIFRRNRTMILTIHAELQDVLESLLAAQIDTVITDPPYSDRVHDRAVSCRASGVVDRAFGFAAITDTLRQDIARLAAHAQRWSAVFSDIEATHLWRDALSTAGAEYVRTVPWVRWSQPQITGDRPPSGCEMITLAHRPGQKRWNGPGSLVVLTPCCLRGAGKHPAEKPLDLLLSLVSWFSDVGETVLDPCAGHGTTGLAARLLGRDAVLVERDAAYAAEARRRCEAPLSEQDRERCRRWVDSQSAWLDRVPAPASTAGQRRYRAAREDTQRIQAVLG